MIEDKEEHKEVSYAFKPLDTLPQPDSFDSVNIYLIDLTECYIKSLENLRLNHDNDDHTNHINHNNINYNTNDNKLEFI